MVVASDSTLHKLVDAGEFVVEKLPKSFINPASVDIPLVSGETYVSSKVFTNLNERYLNALASHRNNISDMVLESGKLYIIEGPEVKMPSNYMGLVDSKSTTGRLGIKSDLITGVSAKEGINLIPPGYEGRTWFMVSPHIPMILSPKDALMQVRLREAGSGFLGGDELRSLYGKEFSMEDAGTKEPLKPNKVFHGHSTVLRTSVERVAMLKNDVEEPVVFDSRRKHDVEEYWKLYRNDAKKPFELHGGKLYLFGTVERIATGPRMCWKLRPISDLFSRFIETHRAGFVDPGFNSTITLEIKNHHENTVVFHEQIATISDWELLDVPAKGIYNGHYQHQLSPALPRQFRNYNKVWD